MAKIYNVEEDFREEIQNISSFFNINHYNQKVTNEEFISNYLMNNFNPKDDIKKPIDSVENVKKRKRKQTSKKELKKETLVDCINILKEQSKEGKKESTFKNQNNKTAKEDNVITDTATSSKNKEEGEIKEKIKQGNKVLNFDHKETTPIEVVSTTKKESEHKTKKTEKEVKSSSDTIEVVNAKKSNNKDTEDVKTVKIFDFIKDDQKDNDETTKYKTNDLLNVIDSSCSEKTIKDKRKNKDNFDRKYFQAGKYVINDVSLDMSVFSINCEKLNQKITKEQNSSKETKKEPNKDKNTKINCKSEQNLLNDCYWPTQLS